MQPLSTLELWQHGRVAVLMGVAAHGLLDLNRQLRRVVHRLAIPVEVRALRAHLTIARGLKFASRPALVAPASTIRLHVRELCLMESARQTSGQRYVLRHSWPLQ